jgi:hypothetical protein
MKEQLFSSKKVCKFRNSTLHSNPPIEKRDHCKVVFDPLRLKSAVKGGEDEKGLEPPNPHPTLTQVPQEAGICNK